VSTFAFLVHPRADVARDVARVWTPLGSVRTARWSGGCGTRWRRRTVHVLVAPDALTKSAPEGGRVIMRS